MKDIHPSWGTVYIPMEIRCELCGESINTTNLLSEEAQFFSNMHLTCWGD